MADMFSITVETDMFNKHILDFMAKSKLSTRTIIRKFALDLLTKIIKKSPVDTGRFRGAWLYSMQELGGRDTVPFTPMQRRYDKRYSSTEENIGKSLGEFKESVTGSLDYWVEIINGVDYAIFLEYGYSKQAPYGMVRLSMREMRKGVLPGQMSKELQKDWNSFYGL